MKKKAILALTMAGLVALQIPMTALAEDAQNHTSHYGSTVDHGSTDFKSIASYPNGQKTVCTTTGTVGTESLNANAIYVRGSAEITVGNAVNNTTDSAATVYAEDATTTVTVNGSAENKGSGIAIEALGGASVEAKNAISNGDYVTVNADNSTVKVSGTVTHNDDAGDAIQAKSGATVEVGNVVSEGSGVDATGTGTTLTIHNDVVVNGVYCAITAEDGAVVTARNSSTKGTDGDVSAAHAQDAGTIIVLKGDAVSDGVGVTAQDGGTIVVEGTVTGTIAGAATDNGGKVIAYEIKSADPSMVTVGSGVYYIINGTENTGISSVAGTTDQTVLNKTYKTARKDTAIKVTMASGYALKAGSLTVTREADGSYSVIVPEGGGVTLEAVMAAVQQAEQEEEKKATVTGSEGNAVSGGQWNMAPGGDWTYRNNGIFKNTWGYIANPYAGAGQPSEGWFWFDSNGVMAAGWKEIGGKWYYFNEVHDGTYGMMLSNTTTPDGKKVGADGALVE